MKFKDVLKVALTNFKKRKGRTFLTSLGVAIGTMLIVTMVGMGTTVEKYAMDEMKNYSNIKKIDVTPMKYKSLDEAMSEDIEDYKEYVEKNFLKIDKSAVEKMKKINGVKQISASIFAPISELHIGNQNIKKDMNIVGYDLKYDVFMEDDINKLSLKNKDFKTFVSGKSLTTNDKDGMLISERYLKDMGITDYDSVIGKEYKLILYSNDEGYKIKPYEFKGKIVGVIDERIDASSGKIVVPTDVALAFRGYSQFDKDSLNNKGYDSINIFAKEEGYVETIGKEIEKMGYSYSSYVIIANQIKNIFVVIKSVLASLGIIVLFVASLGIVNTMTMSIYERTKSIGIMKSIGASRTNIKSMFMVESAAIGFIGGVMGIVFSLINSKLIEFGLTAYLADKAKDVVIKYYLPAWLVWGALIFSIALAVIAGFRPSAKAAKLDPIVALNSK